MATSQNALSAGSAPRSRGAALSAGALPPPPPMLAGQQQQSPMPQGGAQSPQGPGMAQPGPQQAPAPTHGQTVAALRHFNAILGELKGLLENPDLGKANLKSTIIDGMTKLVAERIIPPAAAVTQLASVPDAPFQQKQWAQNHYAQTVQASAAVLDHHRQSAMGTGNYDLENALHEDESDPDSHMETMQGTMAQHYAGGQQ
jgi:hypothetical protein